MWLLEIKVDFNSYLFPPLVPLVLRPRRDWNSRPSLTDVFLHSFIQIWDRELSGKENIIFIMKQKVCWCSCKSKRLLIINLTIKLWLNIFKILSKTILYFFQIEKFYLKDSHFIFTLERWAFTKLAILSPGNFKARKLVAELCMCWVVLNDTLIV